MPRAAALAWLAIAAAPTAAAEDVAFCDVDPVRWHAEEAAALAGFWQVSSGPGVLTMGGRSVALPPGPDSSAAIEAAVDGLTITGGPSPGTWPLNPWTGPDLDFTPPEGTPGVEGLLDTEEMGLALGCDVNALPRLHAAGSFTDPEGRVDFDLYLVVQSEGLMTGVTVGRLNGGQGVARRTLTLTR